MEWNKILCPVAFEEGSVAALKLAEKLVAKESGTLILLHVVPVVLAPMEWALEPYKAAEQEARTRLEAIAQRLAQGFKRELIVCVGDPAQGILDTAKNLMPDLIVMSTHGRSGLAHFFLGSVAERVIREAPCPVLTVRPETITSKSAA